MLVAVGGGGAVGTLARYGLGGYAQRFSATFPYEAARLIEDGSFARAGAYAAASVVLSLAATFAGLAAAARLLSPPAVRG